MLKFHFFKWKTPTLRGFQAIGINRNFDCIFLHKLVFTKTLISTLCSHTYEEAYRNIRAQQRAENAEDYEEWEDPDDEAIQARYVLLLRESQKLQEEQA